MPLRQWRARAAALPGTPGVRSLIVDRAQWSALAQDMAAAGGRLLALWGSPAPRGWYVQAAFLADRTVLVPRLRVADPDVPYPGIESVFPAASRMQRALADLCGVRSTDPDTRPWLRHDGEYAFTRVEGEGVHEIAVGPVHAGIIEPGQFRFAVVGERVLRLEERLGFVHKGVEQRFTELPALAGHRLAARVSGDSAAAFSWAYCQAVEALAGVIVPARAVHLRALGLECERIANHLGDLGALGNDAGFAVGLAQFSRLKEQLLRVVDAAFGERYLMETIVPGGVRADPPLPCLNRLCECVREIAAAARVLRGIYDEHEGLRDRFGGAGTVAPELAARLGLTGLAGRASGQDFDLRSDLPHEPYTQLGPARCGRREGDVAARVAVRFDEVAESARLIERLAETLPAGASRCEVPEPPPGWAIGLTEGWRGPALVALECGESGRIRHCHPHDPSWQNWPALEYAVIGNIVPDFPLINKSFNLSYSGHDL
jgi:Ni,Fe-hydrogenase III large subunit